MSTLFRIVIWFGLLAIAMAFLGVSAPIEPVIHFAIGWYFSIARLVGSFESTWALLWWFLTLVVLTTGVHLFIRTWSRAKPRWRQSFSTLSILWMSLIAGMCIGGAIHQIGWLATSPKILANRYTDRAKPIALFEAGHLAADILDRHQKTFDWRKEWHHGTGSVPRLSRLSQSQATFLTTDSDGNIVEVILWPRNSKEFEKFGGAVVTRGQNSKFTSFEETTALLEKRRAQQYE